MIGIFGGTFDPVHLGHLALAKIVHEQVGLERVIFVPLGVPPHRPQPHAPAELRVRLLRRALEPYDYFEVDTHEVDKPDPSWTVKTLEYFAQLMPGETLCLMMGSDAFKSLNTWYHWRSITDFCHVAVVSRKGDQAELDPEVAGFLAEKQVDALADLPRETSGGILWIEADIPAISSTSVREQIASGEPLRDFVPEAVEAMIIENGIYGHE